MPTLAPSSRLRLAVGAAGDPLNPRTQSGVPANLIAALDGQANVVACIDAGLRPWQHRAAAAATVHLDRDQWRRRMRRGRCGTWLRTRNLSLGLSAVDDVDAVLLIRSIYRPTTHRYVPYIDNTVHTVMEHWRPWIPGKPRFAARALSAEGDYLRGAHWVFTTSGVVARSVTEYHGVPAERVTVVGGGAHFGPVMGDDERREPMLLFVGYDYHRKGGDLLVRAFREVRREVPDSRLVVVGPEVRIDEPGVECLGPIRERERISDLMARAGVFVLPARFEPYGMVLLEAMAHGAPCVGTAVGAIAEIIDDGVTGFVVAPDDEAALAESLIRLLSDRALALRLGAAGRDKVVSELNWPAVARRIVQTLSERASSP